MGWVDRVAGALCAGACGLVPQGTAHALPDGIAAPRAAAPAGRADAPNWPGLRGAATPERPPSDGPGTGGRSPAPRPALVAVPAPLALLASDDATRDPATAPPAADAPTPRALECAAALRLPWGPIGSCRDAIVWGAIAATTVGGFVAWWHRGLDTRFDIANEGWFGPDTYSGGIDKLGHGFSFYVATRLVNRSLGWAGVPPAQSLPQATTLALGLGLGVEVLDALARGGGYGFSWQDLAIDVAGTALGVFAELRPGFDRWFAVRWLRSSAGDPERTYDHHQYYAVLRLSGWSALGPANPLRYVELMVGYGATGFRGDDDTQVQSDERRRTLYVGMGLNLTEVLERSVFAGDRGGGWTQWFATELLRYVQVPGTIARTEARSWRP